MKYATIIDRLEADIRQYRIDYQRFFNGDTHIPPEPQEERIRRRINSLVGEAQLGAVDRFRLGGLESRFNSFKELFGRRMQEMSHQQRAAAHAAASQATPEVVLGRDSHASEVAHLYDAIYGERKGQIALEDFHDYLNRQAEQVRRKAGCDAVRFTVRSEDGKPKLKARPDRADPRPKSKSPAKETSR